jgi:transposase
VHKQSLIARPLTNLAPQGLSLSILRSMLFRMISRNTTVFVVKDTYLIVDYVEKRRGFQRRRRKYGDDEKTIWLLRRKYDEDEKTIWVLRRKYGDDEKTIWLLRRKNGEDEKTISTMLEGKENLPFLGRLKNFNGFYFDPI